MSAPQTRPTMGDIAITIAEAARAAGKIKSYRPVERDAQGKDIIRMVWPNGSIHSVYLPTPADAPAREGGAMAFMRHAGIKPRDVFASSAPSFSGAFPHMAAVHAACTAE